MLILGLLGMYFDAAVVFVTKSSLEPSFPKEHKKQQYFNGVFFLFQKTVHLLMASLNHLKIYLFANPDEDSANQWKFELRVDLSADFLKS